MIKISIKTTELAGCAILVRNSEDKILLLKRSPQSHFAPDLWGFPGGKIEAGESALEAVVRETQEETQLRVTNVKSLGVINNVVAAYFTDEFEGEVEIDFEHTDWKWVSRAHLANYELAPSVEEIYEKVIERDY